MFARLSLFATLSVLVVGCDDTTPDSKEAGGDSAEPVTEVDPDADGDGSPDSEDCADDDPTVHPGAEEICDGLDNNCDGQADEGLTVEWYLDADGDGEGSATAESACEAPSDAHVSNSLDCDDSDAELNHADVDGDGWTTCDGDCADDDGELYPSAFEACNEQDDDCDDVVDEFCGWPDNTFHHSLDLTEPGPLSCDARWTATGEAYADSGGCVDCEYTFEVDWVLADSSGPCAYGDMSWTLGFISDYHGYGSVLSREIGGYWYPYFWAYADYAKGEVVFGTYHPLAHYHYDGEWYYGASYWYGRANVDAYWW